eukprot:CFRG0182T1
MLVGYGFNEFHQLGESLSCGTENALRIEHETDRELFGANGDAVECFEKHGAHFDSPSKDIKEVVCSWSFVLHLKTDGVLEGRGWGWENRFCTIGSIANQIKDLRFEHIAASDVCVAALESNRKRIIKFAYGDHELSEREGDMNLLSAFEFETKIKQVCVCNKTVYAVDQQGSSWICIPNEANSPTRLDTAAHVSSIACGLGHVLLLTDAGEVLALGSNRYGQVGLGYVSSEVSLPTTIPALEGMKMIAIAAGSWHSMALSTEGDVYTWGNASDGQLGRGADETACPGCIDFADEVPVTVCNDEIGPIGNNVVATKISAGRKHSVVVDSRGRAWGFGNNKYGQLGTKLKTRDFLTKLSYQTRLSLPKPQSRLALPRTSSQNQNQLNPTQLKRDFEKVSAFPGTCANTMKRLYLPPPQHSQTTAIKEQSPTDSFANHVPVVNDSNVHKDLLEFFTENQYSQVERQTRMSAYAESDRGKQLRNKLLAEEDHRYLPTQSRIDSAANDEHNTIITKVNEYSANVSNRECNQSRCSSQSNQQVTINSNLCAPTLFAHANGRHFVIDVYCGGWNTVLRFRN